MSIQINGTTVINALDRRFILGSTAPASPVQGHVRYNSSTNKFEVYNGTSWVAFPAEVIPPPAWSWGRGSTGVLGNNSTSDRSSPGSIVGDFTDWVQLSAGDYQTAGVRANGTLWSWGFNQYGRLGDNTTTDRSSPVSVVGGFTNWIQVSAGRRNHMAAVQANGTAWGWGNNNYGQLGDNSSTTTSSPVSVVGGFTDWTQISAGAQHTAAVRANGTAWCWGRGYDGRLGNNNAYGNRSSPVSVVGGFTDWIQVDAGFLHTGGVRANGSAWCWGNNGNGNLGDGTTTARSSPVSILSAGLPRWVQISAFGRTGTGQHSGAVKSDGTAWCWGLNTGGQLGDNTTTGRSSPVSVVGGFFDWVQISTGHKHTMALRANGTVWGWGYRGNGRLGDGGYSGYRSSPISVVGGFTDWVTISSSYRHAVALRAL
jgi:alpha-tubulin suppressor-like RCC1 family protein